MEQRMALLGCRKQFFVLVGIMIGFVVFAFPLFRSKKEKDKWDALQKSFFLVERVFENSNWERTVTATFAGKRLESFFLANETAFVLGKKEVSLRPKRIIQFAHIMTHLGLVW
jgi:hypothetical protein